MQNEQLPGGAEFVAASEGIREYRLANGMKALLVENRVAPVATFLVLYKVGSRNEAVGYTGSTHLLEHMLFKGTPTFNKQRNTQIAATLQKIGADFNATTWYDRTNYYETVPSDQLELAIRLEADRMRNSFIADADRQSEMTVVRNEMERGQNEPLQVLDEAVYATAFREHPYHHPTIGWRADVENVPTARLKAFYDTFYHPNNATVIVVGDFERAATLELIERYFGVFAATGEPIPEVYTDEPSQQGERRLIVRRAGELALVQIAFRIPAALGQTRVLSNEELAARAVSPPSENDTYPLVVLSAALSNGVTSRLYQALVETELAVNLLTNADQFRDPGLFNIHATVHPGVAPGKVEEVICEELGRIGAEGLTDAEVEKAKQQILAQAAYNRDGTFNIASQMSEAEAVADWRFYKDYPANIKRVAPADIQRVVGKYFNEDSRTVGHFIPKLAANGGNGNGSRHTGAGENDDVSAPGAPLAVVPHGAKFYDEPGVAGAEADETFATNRICDEGVTTETDGKTMRQTAATTATIAQHGDGVRGDESPEAAEEALTSASAGRSNFSSRVARAESANGAVVLVLENHATPTVSLRGSIRAGSCFEPRDKPGLARLTADMLERGTLRRTKLEIANDLESVGAQIEFEADWFAVNISARALAKDLPRLLATLAEELREPAFPADELEKLKQQTVAAIQEQQANTRFRAYERLTQLAFDAANPFYVPPGDQLVKSINSLTTDDVRGFYEKFYGGRSLILAVAGDVAAGEVHVQFERAFGDFRGPEDIDINVEDLPVQDGARREIVLLKEKANVDILIGGAVPLRRASTDYYAAMLANSALGESTLSSRLGLQVRDREGLTYGIGSRFRAPGLAAGPWYIAVSVNPQNIDRAVASALEVLSDYVAGGIRADELADEKSSAIGGFKVSLSTNAGLTAALWNAEFYRLGIDYIDIFPQLIQAVTLAEVNAAIRKYFRPDHLTIVVAGDTELLNSTQ